MGVLEINALLKREQVRSLLLRIEHFKTVISYDSFRNPQN